MGIQRKINFTLLFCAVSIMAVSTGALASLEGDFGPDVPNFTQTVTLDKYTGASPLTGVKITLSLTVYDGRFEFDNDSDSAATVVVDLDVPAAMYSNDVTLPSIMTVTDVYDQTVNLGANDGDNKRAIDVGGGDYESLNTGTITSSVVWNVSAANFAEYIGPGTFDVSINVSELLEITADRGVAFSTIPVLAEGFVSVEYIPEPATIAILALGGFAVRKRRYPRA